MVGCGPIEEVGIPVAAFVDEVQLSLLQFKLALDGIDGRQGFNLLQTALVQLVSHIVESYDPLPVAQALEAVELGLEPLEAIAPVLVLSLLGLDLLAALSLLDEALVVFADPGSGLLEQILAAADPRLDHVELPGELGVDEGHDEDSEVIIEGIVAAEAVEAVLDAVEVAREVLAPGLRLAAALERTILVHPVVGHLDDPAAGGGGSDVGVVGVHGWLQLIRGCGCAETHLPRTDGSTRCIRLVHVRWG